MLNTRSVRGEAIIVSENIIDTAADVSILTETWLQDEDAATINNLRPPGYSFTGIGKQQKRDGGLGIVHNIELSFISTSSVEYSLFEHYISRCKHLTVIAVYLPPSSSIPVFLDQFEDITSRLNSAAGRVVITGDFNLSVDVGSAPVVSRFKDMLTAPDLHICVDCSTQRCGHTLDLVISRASDSTKVSVFNSEITEHKSLIFPVHYTPQQHHPRGKAQSRRDFRHVYNETLTGGIVSRLSRMDLSPTHPDTILDQYTFAVDTALDEHAHAVLRRPRYCADIHAMRKLRRHNENVWLASGLEIHRHIYVDHRNAVSKEICTAKIHHMYNT